MDIPKTRVSYINNSLDIITVSISFLTINEFINNIELVERSDDFAQWLESDGRLIHDIIVKQHLKEFLDNE